MTNIIEIRVVAVNETAAGLEEARAEAKNAAAEIGDSFKEAGPAAGEGFAEGFRGPVQEQAATTAEDWAAISDMFPAVGAQAGDGYVQGFAESTASGAAAAGTAIGEELSGGITEGMSALDLAPELDRAAESASIAGEAAGLQFAGGVESSTSTVGDVVAARISEQLRQGMDEAAQATMGQLGAIMNSGVGGMTLGQFRLNANAGAALSAALSDMASEAGGEAGDALMAALASSAAQGAKVAAGRIGEAVEATLTDSLTHAGATGADALSAGLSVDVEEGVGGGVSQGLEQAASRIEDAEQAMFEKILFGGASTATKAGLDQGAALGEGVAAGIEQAAPAVQAGAQEMLAEAASTGSPVADALIAKIVEARQAVTDQLVALAVTAGEEGQEAGGRFATFFSQAVSGVRLVFSKDPEKAAAAGAEAGREYANAMVDELEAELGGVPAVAAEEGEAAGNAFARFFSGAASGVMGVFAKDSAVAGGDAGIEFGEAMVEQLEARLDELTQGGDAGFAQAVEEQLAAQLQIAADEATAEYERTLTEGLASAQAEAAGDSRLDVMFSNLAQGLPQPFVDAFATIRANIALTEEEFAQFTEFGQGQLRLAANMLAAGGQTAADPLMERLSARGFNEILPDVMAPAAASTGALEQGLSKVDQAAQGASHSMGGMAGIMMGPVGMAAMGLMSVLPMISGAFTSASVSAATFTQAIGQDAGAVGSNTAAVIQQTLAASGLNDMAQKLGVSQATLIEYAAGEGQAQQAVAKAYNAKQDSLQTASQAEGIHSKAQNDAGNAADQESTALANQKGYLDLVTKSVQQAIQDQQAQTDALLAADQTTQIYTASVNALGSQMLLNAQNTLMSNQATTEYSTAILNAMSTTKYMNAAVGAAGEGMLAQQLNTQYTNMATIQYGQTLMALNQDYLAFNVALQAANVSMQEQAQNAAIGSVGLLNLGAGQYSLNQQLVTAETAYTEASNAGNAYGQVLTSLSGSASNLLSSEAAFTTQLDGLTKAVQTNGSSLDVNNAKGAANITTITGIATAADKAAAAVYQSDIQTGKASIAYQDATTKLDQQRDAFIAAADKAGLNTTAVQQLANQLFQLPANVTTTVNVNTSAAMNAIDALLNQIMLLSAEGINTDQQGHALVMKEAGHAYGGIVSTAAVGGGRAGLTMIDEQGPELANLPNGTQVMPAANTATAFANGFGQVVTVQLVLDGSGGSDLENAIWDWAKKKVRVKGGGGKNSVQVALGQVH